MKMWEQSFQCLNATLFFEEHKSSLEQFGYTVDSQQEYYQEVMTSPDFNIPTKYSLPENPEDWVQFSLPEEFVKRCKEHEDNIMISRFIFAKPELTLYHLRNIFSLLESHFFTI